MHHCGTQFETEVKHRHPTMETCGTERVSNEHHNLIVPHEDDIEKSFCVNEDGSMTVEMKVHLTIKEEEVLHWTTTLSRSSLSKRTVTNSILESGNNSPDANNAIAEDSCMSEDEMKEENHPAGAAKAVGFNDKKVHEGYTATTLRKTTVFKRTPTPGPRHIRKKASIESVKTVTESGVEESTLGHYSYMEQMVDGEKMEGYCVVRHSSNSGNRPIPKPRKTASAGAIKRGSCSSISPPGVAEVLQIQNNGMEVTETVMHIYESQGCYENYFANEEPSTDSAPVQGNIPVIQSKPSTVSGPRSPSNDCDIDFSTTDSLQRHKEEMLSLSSEPICGVNEVMTNLPSVAENEARNVSSAQVQGSVKKDKTAEKKKMKNPSKNQNSSNSTSSSDKKQTEFTTTPSKHSKRSSTDKLDSNKKSLSSLESAKSEQKSRGAEKPKIKKVNNGEMIPRREEPILTKTENVKRTPSQRRDMSKAAPKYNGHNVNTPTIRPQMKKNMSDILQPKKSLSQGKKTNSKPKSMTENKISSPQKYSELSDSFSMPSLNLSPSDVQQYVENWLEKISPDSVPYTEDAITDESEPRTKVVFQIGADSELDEKNGCCGDQHCPSPSDAVNKSTSCLSVPLCHPDTTTALQHKEPYVRGLCVSMPSVRVDLACQENRLKAHKSAEASGPADNESASSTANILSPKEKINPVPRQLCSSVQCIRRASEINTTSNLEKANSLPDFPLQVASVFGSSCKAFLSFLSLMTLRDNLSSSPSRSTSEAKLMMESLQKISAINDEEEQRASLTDLQSRASSQFRERWKDFQILKERLESEPLSPKVSETEFALDVVSEGGDVFEDQHLGIDELMEELKMPQDLRAEISSVIQQAKGFYPVEESTFVDTEGNLLDSEEDVEKFIDECRTEQGSDDNDQGKIMTESEPEPIKVQETCNNAKEMSRKEGDEPLHENEGEEDRREVNDKERDSKEADEDDGEETETGEWDEEAEEGAVTKDKMVDNGQEEWEAEKGIKEEEETTEKVEKEPKEEEELVDEEDKEAGGDDSFEESDEREGVEETEEDDEGADEEENCEGRGSEAKKGKEVNEDTDEVIGDTDDGEEVDNIEEVEEEEKEEEGANTLTEDAEKEAEAGTEEDNEEMTEVTEDKEEEENVEHTMEEMEGAAIAGEVIKEQGEEEVIKEDKGGNVEETDEEEEKTKMVSEENSEEGDEGEESVSSYEGEEGQESDRNIEGEERCDEGGEEGRSEQEETRSLLEEDSTEIEENGKDRLDKEEKEDNDDNRSNETLDQVEGHELEEGIEEVNVSDDADYISGDLNRKLLLEEALYMQQLCRSEEEATVVDKSVKHDADSPCKYSSEGQCEDEKGTDAANGLETDEGGEHGEERSSSLKHPVEISQELLDFVNSALQSSSLIFTYDVQGNVRIEPDNARVAKQTVIPQRGKDSSYGLKCLPSPCTSDLSDYRPETSESGGYKTQDSVDIATESEENASEKPSPVCRRKTDVPSGEKKVERVNSQLSVSSSSESLHNSCFKSEGSISSFDSASKASRDDLCYFSAASSEKADSKPSREVTQSLSVTSEKGSLDGVLIDQGRWLLKENHLIRKSPPVSMRMYGNVDSTSIDTSQENSEDSPSHHKAQHNPLAAISSSELEEMAKPQTPKCTYYHMPHGSDSDPFLDDLSLRGGKNDTSSVKGRGFRVSPVIDTSKTWGSKNGSLSSFTSVEFKIPDRKVHPEGESSAVTQARRTSSGGGYVLHGQDTQDTLHLRCGQYCPIL